MDPLALARDLAALAPEPGVRDLPIAGLHLFRADAPTGSRPVVYEPGFVVVGQGRKRATLAGEVYEHDPGRIFIVSVPMPIESEVVDASEDEPFLALRVPFEMTAVGELAVQLGDDGDDAAAGAGDAVRAVAVAPLDAELGDAVGRLARSLLDVRDARILAPLHLREALYRLLAGDAGRGVRALVLGSGRSRKIGRVLREIHTDPAREFDIAALAKLAAMSASTFHEHFKGVMSMSPLQYVKSVRLHQARSLMLGERMTASEASQRVGYRNASQFSREFRRLFGASPTEEVARLREQAVLPPGLYRGH